MLDDLPILGVCGWSGSGKTTLIEGVVPRLCARGLSVAVVKHDAHGIDVDQPGKDSDRFFRAGADVLLQGPGEQLARTHDTGGDGLTPVFLTLIRRHDIVLVEGHKDTPLPKVWLAGEAEGGPPPQCTGILAVLPPDSGRADALMSLLDEWLPRQWLKTPVFGCLMAGAREVEGTVNSLRELCEIVVTAGASAFRADVSDCLHLPDVPDAAGPVASLLAAMRWAPRASWLVASGDLPPPSPDRMRWLLSTRAPGVWATLPRSAPDSGPEPLLAHYDFRARLLLERLAAEGSTRLSEIASSEKVITPSALHRAAPG